MRYLMVTVFVLGLTRAAGGQPYRVLPKKSKLVGRLFRAGVAARLAHDHVILARGVRGTVELDPKHPERARVEVTLETRELDPDPPELRKRYGMKPLDAKDVAKIRRNMQTISQLFVARYPSIAFQSSSVKTLGHDRFRIEGTLSIRGVKRRVTLEVKARLKGGTLKASGQLRFKQSSFGYTPYSAALGLIKVKDAALVDIYVEARRPKR
jgi:polyisoprenoid-binding protein YceI